MPTTRPRYVVTDTGAVRALLDEAAEAWPETTSRKQLLLRLAAAGRDSLVREREDRARRRERQEAALNHAATRVDVDLLLGDAAWR